MPHVLIITVIFNKVKLWTKPVATPYRCSTDHQGKYGAFLAELKAKLPSIFKLQISNGKYRSRMKRLPNGLSTPQRNYHPWTRYQLCPFVMTRPTTLILQLTYVLYNTLLVTQVPLPSTWVFPTSTRCLLSVITKSSRMNLVQDG